MLVYIVKADDLAPVLWDDVEPAIEEVRMLLSEGAVRVTIGKTEMSESDYRSTPEFEGY